MRIHDVTVTLEPGLPGWPGDPPVERSLVWHIGQESAANVSYLKLCAHAGTHVDAPIHYLAGGADAASLELDDLVGPCCVCEVRLSGQTIGPGDLDALRLAPGTRRLLLKTSNSALWQGGKRAFTADFVSLSVEAARWIVEHGVRLVGIDYLSVEALDAPQGDVHRTLLAAGVIVLEGVDLSGVPAGEYTIVCLPLKIAGSDGAPARVVLIEE